MRKAFFILFLSLMLNFNNGWSQSNLLNAKVPQEIGIQEEEYQNPIAYGYIDDRDVLWSKTIWEIINLNERINFPYYYPTKSGVCCCSCSPPNNASSVSGVTRLRYNFKS